MKSTHNHTKLEDALEVWLLDAAAARLTPRTIDFYHRSVINFMRWAGAEQLTDVEHVTTLHVRRYLAHLHNRGYSANYQHNLARVLRQFLAFCVREGILQESPFTANVRAPRMEHKELRALTDDELRRVLRACDNRRDRAMVRLLASSGVRAAELCNLDIGDIDMASGLVRVRHGKQQKDRVTFCDSQARKALKLYLLERPGATLDEPLFLTQKRAERMTPNGIVQLFRRLQKSTGIAHVTAHALRRTFALNCLRGGMNVHVLARLMGHADVAVLARYLPLAQQDLEAEYNKRGPKEV